MSRATTPTPQSQHSLQLSQYKTTTKRRWAFRVPSTGWMRTLGIPLSYVIVVLGPNTSSRVGSTFTVHLSYDDLHGAGLTGPSAIRFGTADLRVCGSYQIPDDNVVENEHTVDVRTGQCDK